MWGGQGPLRHARCCLPRCPRRHVHDRWPLGCDALRGPVGLAADRQRTSSWRTSTTCSSVAPSWASSAGFYFWWPKVFGHKLDERKGKWHFWLNLHRLQHDLRAHARVGPPGHAPPLRRPTTRVHRLRAVEHGVHHRRAVPRLPAFLVWFALEHRTKSYLRLAQRRPASPTSAPIRGTPGRWSGSIPSPTPAPQLRHGRRRSSHPGRRLLASQVPQDRGSVATTSGSPRALRSPRPATATRICRHRRTGRLS